MYNSQLKTFVHVVDCGSFTKAAEKLFLSSTAVMKQINALEEHVGLVLLERNKQGVRLTAAGRSLYEDALQIFQFSQDAIARARHAAQIAKTTLRVGTSMLNPCTPLMDLWQKISDDIPQYDLHVVPFEDKNTDILYEIDNLGKKFDFLVGACDSKLWLQRCNFYKIGEYALCCAVPRRHRLASKTKLDIEDLYGECLVMGEQGDSITVDNLREYLNNQLKITIKNTSCLYDIDVFNYCEYEKNILLTLECWGKIHPAFVTIAVNWDFSVPYGIVYPHNPSKKIVDFINYLNLKAKNLSF